MPVTRRPAPRSTLYSASGSKGGGRPSCPAALSPQQRTAPPPKIAQPCRAPTANVGPRGALPPSSAAPPSPSLPASARAGPPGPDFEHARAMARHRGPAAIFEARCRITGWLPSPPSILAAREELRGRGPEARNRTAERTATRVAKGLSYRAPVAVDGEV